MHRDEFPIPEPCGEAWDEMAGGERRRHCERCRHAVYDLSSMTEKRVRRLLQKPPQDLCVSYLSDERGQIQFRKAEASVSRGLSLGVALSLAACSNPLTRTTGDPVQVRPTPSASTALLSPLPPADSAASAAPGSSVRPEPTRQISSAELASSSSAESVARPRGVHRTAGVPRLRPGRMGY
jgi:hypothetical protein